MDLGSKMEVSDVNLFYLAEAIRKKGRPVLLNSLALVAVQAWLEPARLYTPGAAYTVGEWILWKGQRTYVVAVNEGENPQQGKFMVINLSLPDGQHMRLAAEVPGAPKQDRKQQDRKPVSEEKVREIVSGKDGLVIRKVIREAMRADTRFLCFQNTPGDEWCLAEMLPAEIWDTDLVQVLPLLKGCLLSPCSTEELVRTIWEQENDGSNEYLLKAFALNVALQQYRRTRWVNGGWVLEEEWRQLQEIPVLQSPRQKTKIPETQKPDTGGDEEHVEPGDEEEKTGQREVIIEEDLEAWRKNRLFNATITLQATHYYGKWLPLTRTVRRVFPPGDNVVTFYLYHWFSREHESFQACVDWNQEKIFGLDKMYEAFRGYDIYPGAKLVISRRDSEYEFDIRTKQPKKEGTVRVRRVFLTDDGELEYEEVDEPRRYEITDEVFIAGARWDDLPALFEQAERAGNSIFGLMYNKCSEWMEANGNQPLYVTTKQLFESIHYDDQGRLTSPATIAWELWRRLAFKPVGDGRYLFRPEQEDKIRSIGLGRRRRRQKRQQVPPVQKDKSPGSEKTLTNIRGKKVWRRWLYPMSESEPFAEELDKWLREWKGYGVDEVRQQVILP